MNKVKIISIINLKNAKRERDFIIKTVSNNKSLLKTLVNINIVSCYNIIREDRFGVLVRIKLPLTPDIKKNKLILIKGVNSQKSEKKNKFFKKLPNYSNVFIKNSNNNIDSINSSFIWGVKRGQTKFLKRL